VPGQTAHTFDTDTVTVASWGPALTFLGGFTGSDPSCEKGGCVQIGAFNGNTCGPSIGIAGLVAVPNAKNLLVRYRVLANPSMLSPTQPPSLVASPFAVDVATPGVDAATTLPTLSSPMKQLASPVLAMSWGTDWTTLQVPIASAGPEFGFSVRAGGTFGACGGLPAPPVDTIVLVDSVTAQ
jgi:hypothetical protein